MVGRLLALFACVTGAHAIIGGVGAVSALSGSAKPVTLGAVGVVAGALAANLAFTGAAMAALWRTDLRRSLPAVYAPLLLSLLLLVWLHPVLWAIVGLTLYVSLAGLARARFGLDRRPPSGSLSRACPRCGYDLRTLPLATCPVCPECGASRSPDASRSKQL